MSSESRQTISETTIRGLLAQGQHLDVDWQQTGGSGPYGYEHEPEPVYWLLVTRYDRGYGEHADLVLDDGTREWNTPAAAEEACVRVFGRLPSP